MSQNLGNNSFVCTEVGTADFQDRKTALCQLSYAASLIIKKLYYKNSTD
jgi:hypothetical protein